MVRFDNVKVWQSSHALVLVIYKITRNYPSDERFGLISQMRRSSVSVPANIAEGSKRGTDKEFCHYLKISSGSLEETKYYLILSNDLGYIEEETFKVLYSTAEEIGRMLQGFIRRLTSEGL